MYLHWQSIIIMTKNKCKICTEYWLFFLRILISDMCQNSVLAFSQMYGERPFFLEKKNQVRSTFKPSSPQKFWKETPKTARIQILLLFFFITLCKKLEICHRKCEKYIFKTFFHPRFQIFIRICRIYSTIIHTYRNVLILFPRGTFQQLFKSTFSTWYLYFYSSFGYFYISDILE